MKEKDVFKKEPDQNPILVQSMSWTSVLNPLHLIINVLLFSP